MLTIVLIHFVLSQAPSAGPKVKMEAQVPIRAITRGPKAHWFGYYDKLQFDNTGRYALGAEVGFEDRAPAPDDVIRLGMIDLKDGGEWIGVGESRIVSSVD